MVTDPKIDSRPAQNTIGIRVWAAPSEFPTLIPQTHDEVMSWLKSQGVAPSGPPIVRYHVINMDEKLEIEMAWPVANAMTGNGRIQPSVLPAGRYAWVLYTGDYSGLMDANRVLVEWAKANNVAWDRWDDPKGDAFACRYENYITDPGEEPDPTKWETEVLIKVAE